MAIEVIIMENKNSLIALAYIKENDNPFIVFCNYIAYCLNNSPGKQLRHDELLGKIESEFGLKMPNHVIKVCTRILAREKKIEFLLKGEGYKLATSDDFDIKEFDIKRNELKIKEEKLINELIVYVKEFNKEWNYNEARENLTYFLVARENAYSLFTDGEIEHIATSKYIPPEWYVGKFITKLLENKDSVTDYLLDIVNGLMIFVGVHQTDDYFQEKDQKFKGTDFYIDTKLLLRVMGYSTQLEIDSASELINLIVNEYGGNICVFEHTIGELQSALYSASECLKKGMHITDNELRLFSNLNKCDAFDFDLYGATVRTNIEKNLKYRIEPSIKWGDKKNYANNLDWNALEKYIENRHPGWKNRAVENDVYAINHINILRKGDYTKRFGGKSKLPIFITSNSSLVWDIREYIIEKGEADKGAANWNPGALPLVSDNMIMCRLWLPKANRLVSIPTLTLARNAMAAQRANFPFFEKLKVTAKELKEKHNIDIIDISEIRKNKLEEILVKNTYGNSEEISPEIIATSVEELIKIETIILKSSLETLEEMDKQKVVLIDTQRQQIINSASMRFINKIGIKKVFIYAAENWWVINTILFGALTIWVNSFKCFIVIYILAFLLIRFLERFFIQINVTGFLLSKIIPVLWEQYVVKIKASLKDLEKDFEKEIILSCLEETKLFGKYSNYCIV